MSYDGLLHSNTWIWRSQSFLDKKSFQMETHSPRRSWFHRKHCRNMLSPQDSNIKVVGLLAWLFVFMRLPTTEPLVLFWWIYACNGHAEMLIANNLLHQLKSSVDGLSQSNIICPCVHDNFGGINLPTLSIFKLQCVSVLWVDMAEIHFSHSMLSRRLFCLGFVPTPLPTCSNVRLLLNLFQCWVWKNLQDHVTSGWIEDLHGASIILLTNNDTKPTLMFFWNYHDRTLSKNGITYWIMAMFWFNIGVCCETHTPAVFSCITEATKILVQERSQR